MRKIVLALFLLNVAALIAFVTIDNFTQSKDFNAWAEECRAKDGSVSIKAINNTRTTYMCVDTLTNKPVGLADMEV